MLRRVTSIIAVAAVAALAALTPIGASATILVDVAASPETITVGQTSTITATELGSADSVVFEVETSPGGSLSAGGASGASIDVAASDGTAQAEFTATEPGTFEISVREGGTVLAMTAVVVTAPIEAGETSATLAATPQTISVGEHASVTAEGLGGLVEASFGLDGTPGGSLSLESGASAATVLAPVTDGNATVEFTATEAGIFTIAVGDGETVLATTTVTVNAAPTTSASATPSATLTSSGADTDADGFPWIIVIVVAVVLVAIGIAVAVILVRRRKTKA